MTIPAMAPPEMCFDDDDVGCAKGSVVWELCCDVCPDVGWDVLCVAGVVGPLNKTLKSVSCRRSWITGA